MDLFSGSWGERRFAGDLAELRFVDVEIAANDGEDELAAAPFEEDGFGSTRGRNTEEIGERLDGRSFRCGDLFDREEDFRGGHVAAEFGDFAVGGVVAGGADEDGVFAVGGESHELVRGGTAHHPNVGTDDDEVE